MAPQGVVRGLYTVIWWIVSRRVFLFALLTFRCLSRVRILSWCVLFTFSEFEEGLSAVRMMRKCFAFD